jgi:hypothetical protein
MRNGVVYIGAQNYQSVFVLDGAVVNHHLTLEHNVVLCQGMSGRGGFASEAHPCRLVQKE